MKHFLDKLKIQNRDDIKKLFVQFIKFGMVGAVNTVLSLVIYYIVLAIDSDKYLLGQVLGWIISTANAFFLSNRFVFQKEEKSKSSNLLKGLGKSYISYGGSFILGMVLLYAQVDLLGVSKAIAPILNLVITIPLNFLVNKFWTFR